MIHYCERCKTALKSGAEICTVCGKPLGAPVTAEPEIAEPILFGTTGTQRRNLMRMGKRLGIGLAGIAVLWAGYSLWMLGPGGEILFMMKNSSANAAFERGNFSIADADYTRMIEVRPHRTDGYLLRAISEYKQGLYLPAIRDNTEALRYAHGMTQIGNLHFNRAQGYEAKSDWKRALQDYSEAETSFLQEKDDVMLQYIPRYLADARRGRAKCLIQFHDPAQALTEYTSNVNAGTARTDDYGMRATCEEQLGMDAKATADYARSVKMDPGYLYGYQGLAQVAYKNHRSADAVEALKRATDANPNNAPAWGLLGWYEYTAGNLTAAIAHDQVALNMNSRLAWTRYNLALCYAVLGLQAKATDAYAEAIAGGTVQEKSGAMTDLRAALSQHPTSTALRAAINQLDRSGHGPQKPPLLSSADTPALAPRVSVPTDFAGLLDSLHAMKDYFIQPPLGYTLKQSHSAFLSGTETIDYWRGSQHPDGTAPDLQVQMTLDDGRIAANTTASQEVQTFLDGTATNHSQFHASAITPIKISGRNFMQASWEGVGQHTGQQFAGCFYASVRPNERILIQIHDTVPSSKKTLSLLKAAIQTFRK